MNVQGARHARNAIIFGFVGVLVGLGLIFGPLALWQAKKAERYGSPTVFGSVLGWIATVAGALVLLYAVFGG
jgi:uncharacterized Tic20 family protein